jgi:acyl-CoA thioester hydrolase
MERANVMKERPKRPGPGSVIPDHCITQTSQRVCVAETDMMGIVHHANYVAYFEKGRLEYLRRRGLPYKALVQRGLHMPVIELNLRYRRPARFDDLLSIETRLGGLSRVTVRFDYTVSLPPTDPASLAQQAPALLVEGHIVLACVDEKGRPRPLPEDAVRTLFLAEQPANEDSFIPESRVGRADSA